MTERAKSMASRFSSITPKSTPKIISMRTVSCVPARSTINAATPYGVTTVGKVSCRAAAIGRDGRGCGFSGCGGSYCSSTTLRATRRKITPAAISSAAREICQFAASARPTQPPANSAMTDSTKTRHTMPCMAAGSRSRVRVANGPSTLSGPSVTKNSVKISPGPIILGSSTHADRVIRGFRRRRVELPRPAIHEAQFLLAAAVRLEVPAFYAGSTGLAGSWHDLGVFAGRKAGQHIGARGEQCPAIAGRAIGGQSHDQPLAWPDFDDFPGVALRDRRRTEDRAGRGGLDLALFAIEQAQLVLAGAHEIALPFRLAGIELVHRRVGLARRAALHRQASPRLERAVALPRSDVRLSHRVARRLASRLLRVKRQVRADAGAVGTRQDAGERSEQDCRCRRGGRVAAGSGAAGEGNDEDEDRDHGHGGASAEFLRPVSADDTSHEIGP